MTIFISWLLNYYCRLWPKLLFNKLFGPTENLAYTFMIISTSIGRLHVLIRSVVYAERTLQFWQENCLLLQNFYKADYSFHGMWFTRLQWETCSIFFTCTSLVIAQTIYVHIYTALKGSEEYKIILGKRSFWPMLPDSEERLGSGLFWTSMNYLRLSNCWLIFFIRLYTVLLQRISRKIWSQFPNQFFREIKSLEKYKNDSRKAHTILEKLTLLTKAKIKRLRKSIDDFSTRPFVENKASINLDLFVEVRKMTRKFNQIFGMEIIWDISIVTNVTIYCFFGCFWIMKGYFQVLSDVAFDALYSGKVILLGWLCGKLKESSKNVVPAIMTSVNIHQMDIETKRRVRLIKCQLNFWKVFFNV